MWGAGTVLHVEHLAPVRSFSVGDAVDGRGRPATDYVIGEESIGCARLPIVVPGANGVAVVVPEGAAGEVAMGETRTSFDELAARGLLTPSPTLAGAREYALARATTARVRHRGFTFVVTRTRAAQRIGAGPARPRWQDHAWLAAVTVGHVALLALFHLLPPRAWALSVERLDTRLRLVPIETTMPEAIEVPEAIDHSRGPEGGEVGRRHEGDSGESGKKDAPKTGQRLGVRGPKDNPDPHLAKNAATEAPEESGIIGTLKRLSGSWDSPTSPYGRESALGRDPMAALGALMGPTIGESGGWGGLDMIGTGRSGGGEELGTVGLDRIGTLGSTGKDGGYGSVATKLPPRKANVPDKVTIGSADVRGALSKEVIQRIIRRHVAEIRYCYEQGLTGAPDLEGRVAVKFVIAPSGAVQAAAIESSSLGSASVEGCIARAVNRWTFPAPEGGGIVLVSYPFSLQQSGR